MNISPTVLRIFVDESSNFGNPVGVVVDEEQKIAATERQKIAHNLGFSETVFVNDVTKRSVSIFTPLREIPFAGHALIGAAHFLGVTEVKTYVAVQDKKILAWNEGDYTWIESDIKSLPDWNFVQLDSPHEVEKITEAESKTFPHTYVWAFTNETAGKIRARTFASDWGIVEDEANGSGSMLLANQLKNPITVCHGQGSVIYAKPRTSTIQLGGRVVK